MYSQLQQTNCVYLQQLIEILQQWIKELVKRGQKQVLQNLLAVIPTIQELSNIGLVQILIQPKSLKIMSKIITESLSKIKEEKKQVQKAIQHQQNRALASNLKINIIHERKKYNSILGQNLPSREKLDKLATQYKAYMQNTNKMLRTYLEQIGVNQAQRYSFQFYQRNLNLMFENYLDQQVLAFEEIKFQYDLLEMKGEVTKTNLLQSGKEDKKPILKKQPKEHQILMSEKSLQNKEISCDKGRYILKQFQEAEKDYDNQKRID